jgi:hypothetical protein
MSDRTLNDIVCLAVIDGKFRHSLLTDVANVVEEFDLDAEERHILQAIKADSVAEFAQNLHSWMLERHGDNGHRKVCQSQQLKNLWGQKALFLEPTY